VTPCSVVVGYQHFGGPRYFIFKMELCYQVKDIWVVTPRSVVVRYQRSGGSEDGGSKALRDVGILPQHYTASQPR
jgi:hypothetical protein